MIKMLRKVLPHICLVFSVVFLVLMILNAYNPYIGFLSGTVFLCFLIVFCLSAFATALVLIVSDRRNDR